MTRTPEQRQRIAEATKRAMDLKRQAGFDPGAKNRGRSWYKNETTGEDVLSHECPGPDWIPGRFMRGDMGANWGVEPSEKKVRKEAIPDDETFFKLCKDIREGKLHDSKRKYLKDYARKLLFKVNDGKCSNCGVDLILNGGNLHRNSAAIHHIKIRDKNDPLYYAFDDLYEGSYKLLCFCCHQKVHSNEHIAAGKNFFNNPKPGERSKKIKIKRKSKETIVKVTKSKYVDVEIVVEILRKGDEEKARRLRKEGEHERRSTGQRGRKHNGENLNSTKGIYAWENVETGTKYFTRNDAAFSTGFSVPTAKKKRLIRRIS
jgi:hypothetical protein